MGRRILLALLLAVVGLLGPGSTAWAQSIFYESALLGPTGQTTGWSISQDQYLGSRFVVSSPITVTAIGGHLYRQQNITGPLFGAVVSFPGSLPATGGGNALSGAGCVIHASVTFTAGFPSNEFIFPLTTPVTLTPNGNTYAVIFGSGLFGASGFGAMAFNNTNTPEGTGSYFWSVDANLPSYEWREGGTSNTLDHSRFVVYISAVPEPTTVALVGLGVAGAALAGRRTRWRRWLRAAGRRV